MSEKSEALYDQALDLLQEGKLKEGIAAIEDSLMEDAEDAMTWRLYGVALTSAGRAEDAAAAMQKAEAFGLGAIDGLLMKGAEAQMAGNLDAAITHFEDALELDEKRFEVWAAYALVLIERGYEKDSLDASEKAVALGPEQPQTWYARGRVLRLTKDAANALPAFAKAVELDAGIAVAWHEQGMVHVDLEDFEAAAKSFERVLELQPGDAAATQALAIVRQRL